MEFLDVPHQYWTSFTDATGLTQSIATIRPAALYALGQVADFVMPGSVSHPPLAVASPLDLTKAVATTVLVVGVVAATVYFLIDKLILANYKPGTFIVDIATFNNFRPEWCISSDEWLKRAANTFNISQENVEWCRKILARSGVGDKTHFPPGISMHPPDLSIASARYEAELVMFDCVDQLLQRNNVRADQIDVLVVNCSIFNPTPSLAAMIINQYKMRDDIVVYNLSGLGCSASPIAVDLASKLLQIHRKKDALAIVVSTENITQNIYMGSEKSMLVTNTLFRMGGAALLLTKQRMAVDKRPAPKYEVTHMVRVHMGAEDDAYRAVFQDADKDMRMGVRLSKDLMQVAAKGLTRNLTRLAPQILPWSELLRYGAREGWRRWQLHRDPSLAATLKPSVPDFKTAIDHFAIHAGGRAVIDSIQKALNLNDDDVKASRDVLYKYGNVSSASIWYEMQNIEENRNPRLGDRFCLLAFGSGMKFNSLVLKKIN